MQTTEQGAEHQALGQAIEFIAGFESDATQDGIDDLLQRLRTAIAAPMARALDGAVMLAPHRGARRIDFPLYLHKNAIFIDDADVGLGYYVHLYQNHCEQNGMWWGREARRDAHGNVWERSLGQMVTDDFGTLVEVPS